MKNLLFTIILVIALMAVGVFFYYEATLPLQAPLTSFGTNSTTTDTTQSSTNQTTASVEINTSKWKGAISDDNTFSISYPNTDYVLLNEGEMVPHAFQSYLPVCGDSNRSYELCVYYSGDVYADTNFESASVSVTENTNLTKDACQNPKEKTLGRQTINGSQYVSYNTRNTESGHESSEKVYQAWENEVCYQIATRIAYATYKTENRTTTKEFTAEDQASLFTTLRFITETIHFLD